MKFKKFFTVFLIITLIFVFNINVSAKTLDYEFTHEYMNPVQNIISLNSSMYGFYSSKYDSTDFTLSNTFRFFIGKMNFNSDTDRFRQHIFNFDTYSIKEKDEFVYIYVPLCNYEVGSIIHYSSTDTYSIGNNIFGTTALNYKCLIKFKRDFSYLRIGYNTYSTVTDIDDYIFDDMSGNVSYKESMTSYDTFYEYQSTFNIIGEIFQNDFDIQNPTYYGSMLSDKQSFINWIIDEQKYTVFGDYGIENTSGFVDDIVDLYEIYQQNPMKLFLAFPQFLIKNGSIFANVGKAKELINYVSALYQEFKLERRPVIYEPELLPYLFPKPWIDDAPNEKYVDDETDTVEIGLLREILRAIIVIPQNVFNLFDYYLFNISSNVSLLADYVGQLPNYLTDLMYNKFISPINSIIDAIENIDTGGSTSIDVIIPSERELEFNDFLNLWNNNFNDIIDNKFPVANQLGTLFDDFFVKAGISTDKDGTIYSYYNGTTVSSSGDTGLSGFYSTFDDANTSYLNDVGYSEDIPSLSIKIKGVNREIINFKFYAKYRQQIFTIMSFILWFAFLLSLYKSLPKIIGNVSDITNTVDEFESKIDKGDNW